MKKEKEKIHKSHDSHRIVHKICVTLLLSGCSVVKVVSSGPTPVTRPWRKNERALVLSYEADQCLSRRTSGTLCISAKMLAVTVLFPFRTCVQHYYCFHLFVLFFFFTKYFVTLQCLPALLAFHLAIKNEIVQVLLAKPRGDLQGFICFKIY